MRNSLRFRLVLANLILLPLFMGVTGLYLDRSYQLSLDSAARERMQLQILTLLAEADYVDGLTMPDTLLEARFNLPNSGLYGLVSSASGTTHWYSNSAVGLDLSPYVQDLQDLAAGQRRFRRDSQFYRYAMAVLWQTERGEDVPLVFQVMEDTAPTAAQVSSFRHRLVLWLVVGAASLVIAQLLVLLWGLRPLQNLAADIGAVERGQSDRLGGDYPVEVKPLTESLDSLLQSEKQRRERTRNTLADLAHSLKTPLAVIRSADGQSEGYEALVAEQVARMQQSVNYHLQKTTAGSHGLLRRIPVFSVVERLVDTLDKVYSQKNIRFDLAISQDARFRGDERDLLELLGNLLDNACKYCRGHVRVSARNVEQGLELIIEDDGPGIAPESRSAILQRGVRADTSQPGHGIGLAVTMDIAASYRGKLSIGEGRLGGARMHVLFPR